MKELLLNYTRFNLWANKRVCDFLFQVEEEKLDKEIVSSFPSLKKTVAHILFAETIWVLRLHGSSPGSLPIQSQELSMTELAKLWLDKSEEIIAYVESRSEEQLAEMLAYKNIAGESFVSCIRDIIQHVVNHGTFHRGQIITMLRQAGYTKLFDTDYIAFCREL